MNNVPSVPNHVPSAAIHALTCQWTPHGGGLGSVLPANTEEIIQYFQNITNGEIHVLCQAYDQYANITIVGCPCGRCPLFLRV